MKKFIFAFIAIITSLSGTAQTFTPECLQYEALTANTARLVSCQAQEGIVIIPQTIEMSGQTYTVTEIGSEVFMGKSFAAVSMPETIITIGKNAFRNCAATFIRMSPAVTTICEGAFQGCRAIGHIDLPQSLTTIENNALSDTPLYTVGAEELPNLTTLGENSFSGSNMLLATPKIDNVEDMGINAFAGCSSLQVTHLPDDLTEIPDGLFKGCEKLQSVSLPRGLTSIGAYAFMDSGIRDIDLTHFNGKIGPMAFNGCNNIERLSLSSDNPYYLTTNDGKVLLQRSTHELVSVLPNIEQLAVEFGTKGEYLLDTLNNVTVYPLSGTFPKLTSLELPYTWTGIISGYFPALRTLTVRASQPFVNYMEFEAMPQVRVFPHAYNAFVDANQELFGYKWHEFYDSSLYSLLELPISCMYMQEVSEMYANATKSIQGDKLLIWESDWNSELQDKHPEYFTAELIGSMGSKNDPITPVDYRFDIVQQYLTDEKMQAYSWQPDSIADCLNGQIRFLSSFDVNDYINWYLSEDNVSPEHYSTKLTNAGSISRIDSIDNTFWLIAPVNSTTNVSYNYPIRMLPGLQYDVYLEMAPFNPTRVTVDDKEVEPKNKIVCTLTYNNGESDGKTATLQSEVVDFEYSGEPQEIPFFTNIEVKRDYFNYLKISSKTVSSDRRNGYSNSLALLGIVTRPKSAVDPLPSDISSTGKEKEIVGYYDVQGRLHPYPVQGINIIRYDDNTRRKVMYK